MRHKKFFFFLLLSMPRVIWAMSVRVWRVWRVCSVHCALCDVDFFRMEFTLCGMCCVPFTSVARLSDVYLFSLVFSHFIVMPLKPYIWIIFKLCLYELEIHVTLLAPRHRFCLSVVKSRRRQFVTRHENGEQKADDYCHVQRCVAPFSRISYSKSKQFNSWCSRSRAACRSYAWCLLAWQSSWAPFICAHFSIGSCVRLDKAKKYSQMRIRVRCTWVISFTSDYIRSAAHKYTDEMYMQRLVLVFCALSMEGSRWWLRCTHNIWVSD